ncbi:hypothetical protein [uncultured Litoreibacter sp.]|uniref:alpha/beta hydrolase family protein n=1 Tax=uncultured Litoreibacter sp. TaxID=1392394 RepID=UPI0026239984|nr:hypothetical protein [uncultured Litoreibacter sp.]
MNVRIETVQIGQPIKQEIEIRSGVHRLAGRLFHPTGTPKAVVIINAATGVRQRYYEAFATWLAVERGLACVTYDYRDFGESQSGALRSSRATMVDWAVHDPIAVRDHIWSLLPGLPIWHLGHSIGGMGLAFQDGVSGLERVITVASGPVHLRDHPWPYRALAAAFWYGPAPLATRLLGYLPGRKLGVGPDLPSGVYWQWRKWCTTQGFFAGDIGAALPYPDYNAVGCPVRIVAAADDKLVPPKAVWRTMDFYREAVVTQKVLKPDAFGLQSIGHIEVFAEENQACWANVLGE